MLVLCLAFVVNGNDFFFLLFLVDVEIVEVCVQKNVVLWGLHRFVVPKNLCLSMCDLSPDVDALDTLINSMVGAAVTWLFTF